MDIAIQKSSNKAAPSLTEDKEASKAVHDMARHCLTACDENIPKAVNRAMECDLDVPQRNLLLRLGWKQIFDTLGSTSRRNIEASTRRSVAGTANNGSHNGNGHGDTARNGNGNGAKSASTKDKTVARQHAARNERRATEMLRQRLFNGQTLDGYFVLGKALGDCTVKDLAQAESAGRSTSATALRRANYVGAIRKALSAELPQDKYDKTVVREVLNEEKVSALLRRYV